MRYYVNDNPQSTGEHEIHNEKCHWLKLTKSTTPLGEHHNCHSALIVAKGIYEVVDGCADCCPDCHTR